MCGNCESTEAGHVLEDIAGLPTERIRRLRQSERHHVTVVGAELNRVNAKYAVYVAGLVGLARRVSMVREDDEVQPRPGCGRGDAGGVTAAVRTCAVHVNRSSDRWSSRRRRRQDAGWSGPSRVEGCPDGRQDHECPDSHYQRGPCRAVRRVMAARPSDEIDRYTLRMRRSSTCV